MVCARALWTLREIVGHITIDTAMLDVFWNYTRGWTTSFETLAEGILEHADREIWGSVFIPVFASRGVIADQGIQALAAASDVSVVVGTDAGVLRRDPATGTWQVWDELEADTNLNSKLQGLCSARPCPGKLLPTLWGIFHNVDVSSL